MSDTTKLTEIKAQLAAARAERAALDDTSKADDELREAQEELRKEQHALALAKVLPELIAKHGDVGVGLTIINTRLGAVVLKRPPSSRWKVYQDLGIKSGVNSNEVEKIIRFCRVYPDDAAFDVIVEELPAACGTGFIGALNLLVGAKREETEGK